MNLISAVNSPAASKVQSAGTAAPDPASSADPSVLTDTAPPGSAPPPPPPAAPTSPIADSMLSTLINLQSSQSLASQAASSLIQALDANGDGSLSLAEANSAMGGSTGADSTSKAAQGFAKLDTNGDGQLSTDELTAAMQALEQSAQSSGAHGRHHHHHHTQVASSQSGAAATSSSSSASSAASDTSAATDPAAATASS